MNAAKYFFFDEWLDKSDSACILTVESVLKAKELLKFFEADII